MKKIIGITLAVLLAVTSFYSCKDNYNNIVETNKFEPINNVTEDTVFTNLLENNFRVVNHIDNREIARQLINKGKDITPKEVDQLAKALGFKNRDAFIQNYKSTEQAIQYLNEKYNFSSYGEEKIKSLAKKAESSISISTNISSNNQTKETCTENCREIYTACATAATGTAVGGQVACAAGDATVVVGAICHAAVYVTEAAALEVCRNQNQKCIRECNNDG